MPGLGAGKLQQHADWDTCKRFPSHSFCVPAPRQSAAWACTAAAHSGPVFRRNPGT